MTITQQIGRALRFSAGTGFAGLLVFAPLNFGSTRPGGSEVLALICALATVLWAVSLLLSGRRSAVPVVAACATAFFMLASIPWIAGFAHATTVSSFTQAHFARVVVRWPVSILSSSPADSLFLMIALVAAFLPLIDLARERAWALTFALSIASTAVVVGLLAMLQNYTQAKGIYWRDDGRMPGMFCGTFFHHTSAGAYFNTAWPLALTLTWLAWMHAKHSKGFRVSAVIGTVAVLILFAAHGTHMSRFPQFAALLVAPFLFFCLRIKIRGPRPWLYGLAGATAIVLLVLIGGRTDLIGARWHVLFNPVETVLIQPPESAWLGMIRDDMVIPFTSHPGWFGDRVEGWRGALSAIAERPLTGHGPGNWIGAASQHSTDPFIRTFYQFLQFTHQDPLQIAVEWGLPAAFALGVLLVGACVVVLWARLRDLIRPDHPQQALAIGAACGLAAVLLQAQLDFPLQIPAIAFNAMVLAALCWAGTRSALVSPSLAA